jgi:hypothetical protein
VRTDGAAAARPAPQPLTDERALAILASLRELHRGGALRIDRKLMRRCDRLSADYFDLRIYGPKGKPEGATDWALDLDRIFGAAP